MSITASRSLGKTELQWFFRIAYTDEKQYVCNEISGIDLLKDVNKLRYIVTYYNGLTAPNDYKDEDISATIEELKFQSTGKTKIYDDVVT